MESSLRAHVPWPVNFSVKYLENPQFEERAYRDSLAETFRGEYHGKQPSLVLVASEPALRFAVAAALELLDAVSHVLEGNAYITPKLRADSRADRETRARQFSKEHSPRQLEVLQLLAEGRPMKEIADILKVSEKTVMFHKYNIMESFNLKNNAELVLFALKHHVISS